MKNVLHSRRHEHYIFFPYCSWRRLFWRQTNNNSLSMFLNTQREKASHTQWHCLQWTTVYSKADLGISATSQGDGDKLWSCPCWEATLSREGVMRCQQPWHHNISWDWFLCVDMSESEQRLVHLCRDSVTLTGLITRTPTDTTMTTLMLVLVSIIISLRRFLMHMQWTGR